METILEKEEVIKKVIRVMKEWPGKKAAWVSPIVQSQDHDPVKTLVAKVSLCSLPNSSWNKAVLEGDLVE